MEGLITARRQNGYAYPVLLSYCDGRGDGRDMGEIKNIPPVLKYLCTKAFPAMTGEMRDFSEKVQKSETRRSEPLK